MTIPLRNLVVDGDRRSEFSDRKSDFSVDNKLAATVPMPLLKVFFWLYLQVKKQTPQSILGNVKFASLQEITKLTLLKAIH